MRWWLVTLVGLYLGPCVRAQIVNIEDKRRTYDTTGWFGQLDLGGSLTENNNTVLTLNGGLRLDRIVRRQEWIVLADYKLVQVSGNNALNAGFGHLRYGLDLNKKWRWESFTQLQYNEQLRLNLRSLIGTGLRRRLVERPKNRAYVGVLYMYEYDELDRDGLTYNDHRLSTYLTAALQLLPNLKFSNTTYYQPVLNDLGDARLSSVSNLSLAITTRVSFTSSFDITYDERLSRDLEDVPSTTYGWRNGLRWRFR